MSHLARFLIIGIIFTTLYLIRFDASRYSFSSGQKVRVTGRVSVEPNVVGSRQKVDVGRVGFYLDRFPEYHYGDLLMVEGTTVQKGRNWILEDPRVIGKKQAQDLLSQTRQRVAELFRKFLPEPESSLLLGIVLGTKSSLDFNFFEALRKTGTLHVVVASGTNISLVGGTALATLAIWVGRRWAVVLALVIIWLYVLLIGIQAPILRAAVMGSVAFAAQGLGREADGWRALLLATVTLLLLNPDWLFDVGFQLSFAATAGILALEKRITSTVKRHLRVPILSQLVGGDLGTSLSAQVATAPLLFAYFGQISPVSPLVNLLVLWTIPFIMAGGAVVAVFGLVWEPLGQAAAWFVYLPLGYFVKTIELF